MPISETATEPASTVNPPDPLPGTGYEAWMLDRGVAYLNHGSFGARARAVHQAHVRRLAESEARPIEWLDRSRRELLAAAKGPISRLLNMHPADFGFVTNATGGVNAVIRSLRFDPGDEMVTTNHVYHAVRQTMKYHAQRAGGTHREMRLPLPLASPADVISAVRGAISDRTRLLVIDHVTSPTGIVLPVCEIIDMAQSRGVDVLVDGAHAPGMFELDVMSLGAAYYTGNLHKWVCAPKGAAFLWVRPDRQDRIHPTTISHFLGEGLEAEFAWQGTRDITPWLSAADSIAWFEAIGWERVWAHNHQLAVAAHAMLCARLGAEPCTPLDGSMLGTLATVRLPEAACRFDTIASFQAALYQQYQIEVPIIEWDDQWFVRVSCQVYNRFEEYERLANAISELINQGKPT